MTNKGRALSREPSFFCQRGGYGVAAHRLHAGSARGSLREEASLNQFFFMDTLRVTLDVCPTASLTVNVTSYVPFAGKSCDMTELVELTRADASPKLQR